jgi:hypothetical protein
LLVLYHGSLRRPERLMQARERLLGPHDLDHNFGSNYLGNPVTIDHEKRKLELIVKVAESVWGSA